MLAPGRSPSIDNERDVAEGLSYLGEMLHILACACPAHRVVSDGAPDPVTASFIRGQLRD